MITTSALAAAIPARMAFRTPLPSVFLCNTTQGYFGKRARTTGTVLSSSKS